MRLQQILSYVRRACQDYEMILEGDLIGIGLSGGKDSIALMAALSELRRFYPKRFDIVAIMVSLGLPGFDHEPAEDICKKLDVKFSLVKTDIGAIVFDLRKEKNPCSLCSRMRKAALNNEAVRLGCTRVALGHNRDDVIQTFLLSLFYEGRIHSFSPVTYLDRTNLYSVRPLIYAPEADIIKYICQNGIQTVKNPCVVDGHTKREEMKNFIKDKVDKGERDFDVKIFNAIMNSEINGWIKANDIH